MTFNVQDLDQHLTNMRSQIDYLNAAFTSTDHNAPDWLATDLVSLRNKSCRLQDDLQRFRDQLQSEGLTAEPERPIKKPRLSLEGAKRRADSSPSVTPVPPSPQAQAESQRASSPQQPQYRPHAQARSRRASPPQQSQHRPHTPGQSQVQPQSQPTSPPQEEYEVQHLDVTEEVNRRLRENRLRRLMDSPSTSQKRKFDIFGETESGGATEGDTYQEDVSMGRSPMKKIKASGIFSPLAAVMKRKESCTLRFGDMDQGTRSPAKRRRM